MHAILTFLCELLWSPPILFSLLFMAVWMTFALRAVSLRYLPYALLLAFRKKTSSDESHKGEISHFQALMAALAGTIGIGNIAGVALAVTYGGMGAIFWMWVTAIFGMAIKYAESLLAVSYRVESKYGVFSGGPMYYISQGLGWKKVAAFYAIAGVLGSLSTGNLTQAQSLCETIEHGFFIPAPIAGLLLAVALCVSIMGGIKSIGNVASILVPFMALFYLGAGLFVCVLRADMLPAAFAAIFEGAFDFKGAGFGIFAAMQMGVARAIYSSESGLGTSAITMAAAKTDSPPQQALISMCSTFISTVLVCSMTAFVLFVSGAVATQEQTGLTAAPLTVFAFDSVLPFGRHIVIVAVILFAFTTILSWAYTGERCLAYLCGEKATVPYRILYVGVAFLGSLVDIDVAWEFADVANALMFLPNIAALVALMPQIKTATNAFITHHE